MLFFAACGNEAYEKMAGTAAKDTLNYTTVHWVDSMVSFGTVPFGKKVTVNFTCKNTGSKPLIITNAKPGCGCTVANFTQTPIAPGESGTVTAELDTEKTKGGTVKKSIIVTTNTSNGIEHYLYFSGEITNGPNDKVMVPHVKN